MRPRIPQPRIPQPLARRLDRLAAHAHRFHRWAHHPLCEEYAGEVLRRGRTRICKGCALAAAGFALGLTAGALLPSPPLPLLVGLLGLGAPWALALNRRPPAVAEPRHHVPPPRPKLATRFLPALLAALAFAGGLHRRDLAGAGPALAAVGLVGWVVAAYRRRGPQRQPCATCPEAQGPVPCRGYREIHRRERAFARLADRWLLEG